MSDTDDHASGDEDTAPATGDGDASVAPEGGNDVAPGAESGDGATPASGTGEDAPGPAEDVESLGELVKAVLWDGVVGAVAGAGGNAVILTVLFVAAQVGAFDPAAYGTVAELLGFDAVLSPGAVGWVGVALFIIGGLTVLPLLLATLGAYLPGRRYATKGVSFGAIVWTGFVLAYYPGYSGISLVLYVVLTLLGHLGYGYVTGWLMDVLFAVEGQPVLATSIAGPAAVTRDGQPRETTLVDDVDEAENS